MLHRERTEQPHLDRADAFALSNQMLDHFVCALGTRPHQHDDPLRRRITHIVEQVVLATRERREVRESGLQCFRKSRVKRLDGFATLEESVRVLRRAPDDGALRVQRPLPVRRDAVGRQQRAQGLIVENGHGADLVRGPEAVEKMQHRYADLQGDRMPHSSQVLRLLSRAGSQQREAGAASGHHIGVVAKDRQRVGGDAARCHVHAERSQLPGDLVHVRQHQQKPLRCREGRDQRPRLQRAVHGAGRAAFGLHLDHLRHGPRQVGLVIGCPDIGQLTHGRSRRDRVDRNDLTGAVGHAGHGLVGVKRASITLGCVHVVQRRSGFWWIERRRQGRPRSVAVHVTVL